MSEKYYKVKESELIGLADSVRAAKRISTKMTIPQMAEEVKSIVSPEGEILIEENGIYDVTAYASANVNIEGGSVVANNGVPILIENEEQYNELLNSPETEDLDKIYDYNGQLLKLYSSDTTEERTLEIDKNGEYSVVQYDKVNVNQQNMLQIRVDATNNCDYLFYKYGGNNVDFISDLDTSNVTSMKWMFCECKLLTSIPQLDTSKVTDMNCMFENCSALTEIPQLDTSNATNMNYMFCNCSSLTFIPQLDTSNVTNMKCMLIDCSALTTVPRLDTSKVTDMSNMFNGCSSLTSIPQLDTSNVTDMNGMFGDCKLLTTIPLLDTSNVTDMTSMFHSCSSLIFIPELDTSNVEDMKYMFYNCSSLTSTPQLDTSNVTDMKKMFYNCTSLKTIRMYGMKVSFDISASKRFDRYDLVKIIKNLATVETSQTLTMGSKNLSKLKRDDLAIASTKGWTIV